MQNLERNKYVLRRGRGVGADDSAAVVPPPLITTLETGGVSTTIQTGTPQPTTWMMPTTWVIQLFSVIPGIAGGLAGIILAQKLSNARSVKASEAIFSAVLVAAATFASVFLIRTVDTFDE